MIPTFKSEILPATLTAILLITAYPRESFSQDQFLYAATSFHNDDLVRFFIHNSIFWTNTEEKKTYPPGHSVPFNTHFENWPSEWSTVDAVVYIEDLGFYIFRGDQYVKCGIERRILDGYPATIRHSFSANWPGSWNSVDAAVSLNNGSVYFFKGTEYIRYDVSEGAIAEGYPAKIQGGFAKNWPKDWTYIDAAVNNGPDKVYMFRDDEFLRYDLASGRVVEGPWKIREEFCTDWPHEEIYIPNTDKPWATNYRIELDICHSDIKYEGTKNKITVNWIKLDGSSKASDEGSKAVDSNCGSFSNEVFSNTVSGPFTYADGRPYTSFEISTSGSDALYIDRIKVYGDDDLIQEIGVQNKKGYCVSKDPKDATRSWSGYVSGGCRSKITFEIFPD